MSNFTRNVLPAIAIMVLGVGGAYVVYDKYFSSRVDSAYSEIEPASGDTTVVDTTATTDTTVTTDVAPADATATTDVTTTDEAPAATTETDSTTATQPEFSSATGEVTTEVPAATTETAPATEGTEGEAPADATTAPPTAH